MPTIPSTTSPAFSLLAKPTGAVCNLACAYCFYLGKTELYPGSRFRMSDEVLEAYIKQYLASQHSPEVIVPWQGGEPTLMGLDFFKHSIELAEKYKKPGQKVIYTLQTNGTRLDDAWCTFFKENNFLIGLSCDGPPALHNVYRFDKRGQGSYDLVKRGWDLLQKYNMDTNILCTVQTANGSHPLEVYRFFRDELGARFIQFIPVVEWLTPRSRGLADFEIQEPSAGSHHLSRQLEHMVTRRSIKPKQYGRFLIDIFEEWVRRDVGTVYVQVFDAALANWFGVPAGECVFQETCGLGLVLEHNGDLYSCDHFVEPGYNLGNILNTPLVDLVTSPRQLQFGQDKRDALPVYCKSCDVRFACHGECPRNRFSNTPPGEAAGGGEAGLNFLCEGYKMFFHHIDRPMRSMTDLLRHQRAPAEIMQMYTAQDASLKDVFAHTGRNDRCPCGSGKKLKHCHGRA